MKAVFVSHTISALHICPLHTCRNKEVCYNVTNSEKIISKLVCTKQILYGSATDIMKICIIYKEVWEKVFLPKHIHDAMHYLEVSE